MKYMLLIHQGDTPTPRDPEAWARLPEDEQKAVFADYQAINENPGVTPGVQMGPPETATTVRVASGSAETARESTTRPSCGPSFRTSGAIAVTVTDSTTDEGIMSALIVVSSVRFTRTSANRTV